MAMAKQKPVKTLQLVESSDVPRIDKNRLSHKQSRELGIKAMKLAQAMDTARADGDFDTVDGLISQSDALQFSYVSYVPASWFTEPNISIDTPEWWDYLGQGYYEDLGKLLRPQKVGEAPN